MLTIQGSLLMLIIRQCHANCLKICSCLATARNSSCADALVGRRTTTCDNACGAMIIPWHVILRENNVSRDDHDIERTSTFPFED